VQEWVDGSISKWYTAGLGGNGWVLGGTWCSQWDVDSVGDGW